MMVGWWIVVFFAQCVIKVSEDQTLDKYECKGSMVTTQRKISLLQRDLMVGSSIFTLGNMEVMIHLGQVGLRSLSASSLLHDGRISDRIFDMSLPKFDHLLILVNFSPL